MDYANVRKLINWWLFKFKKMQESLITAVAALIGITLKLLI